MTALSDCQALDAADVLASKRAEFKIPAGKIYLNGNSLGPLPVRALAHSLTLIEQQWGEDLISSWNKHGWIDLPLTCAEKLGPLVGVAPGQLLCCDSVSVNLFKLLAVALQLNKPRTTVVSLQDNFPTDLYMVQGMQSLLGAGQCELQTVDEEDLLDSLNREVAVLLLTQVNFRSGAMLDIQSITQRAHELGILVIWDLSHSVGAVPLQLDAWSVDMAVGCGYKYLNGGPGAPAFLYVNKQHQAKVSQPLCGWMGHTSPFEFSPDYVPAKDITEFLTGTPPILSLGVLSAALDVFADVTPAQLRSKSLALADYFLALVAARPELNELELVSPVAAEQRGGQLAFAHEEGYAICQALAAAGILSDFRSPDLLRFGFSPLFLRFADIAKAVTVLADIVAQRRFDEPAFKQRQKVT